MASGAKATVKDQDLGYSQIIAEIEKMSKSYVKIGLLANSRTVHETKVNQQTGEIRHKEGGKSIAQIGIENEYGTKRQGKYVPARPFVSSTYDENRERIYRILEREQEKIVAGKSTVFKSLSAIGIYITGLIQQKIRAIRTPPNSPITVALKGSDKPLIDFGQMIQAVTHEVVIQ